MRHFAEELRRAGHKVIYVQYNDPENSGTFSGEVARHLTLLQCDQLIVTELGNIDCNKKCLAGLKRLIAQLICEKMTGF